MGKKVVKVPLRTGFDGLSTGFGFGFSSSVWRGRVSIDAIFAPGREMFLFRRGGFVSFRDALQHESGIAVLASSPRKVVYLLPCSPVRLSLVLVDGLPQEVSCHSLIPDVVEGGFLFLVEGGQVDVSESVLNKFVLAGGDRRKTVKNLMLG